LNQAAISWRSQRQPTVAASTTEAEYMSLFSATQEAIWLRRFLNDIKIETPSSTVIYQDNQGCIQLAHNAVFHARTKHIDIRHHFIREQIAKRAIVLKYLPTEDMIADGLTKDLPRPKFEAFVKNTNVQLFI
jgi:hypothetical protein